MLVNESATHRRSCEVLSDGVVAVHIRFQLCINSKLINESTIHRRSCQVLPDCGGCNPHLIRIAYTKQLNCSISMTDIECMQLMLPRRINFILTSGRRSQADVWGLPPPYTADCVCFSGRAVYVIRLSIGSRYCSSTVCWSQNSQGHVKWCLTVW